MAYSKLSVHFDNHKLAQRRAAGPAPDILRRWCRPLPRTAQRWCSRTTTGPLGRRSTSATRVNCRKSHSCRRLHPARYTQSRSLQPRGGGGAQSSLATVRQPKGVSRGEGHARRGLARQPQQPCRRHTRLPLTSQLGAHCTQRLWLVPTPSICPAPSQRAHPRRSSSTGSSRMAGNGRPWSNATDLQAAFTSGGSHSGISSLPRPSGSAARPCLLPPLPGRVARRGDPLRLRRRGLPSPRRRPSPLPCGLRLLLQLRLRAPLCCAAGPSSRFPASSGRSCSGGRALPKGCSGRPGGGGRGGGRSPMPPSRLPPGMPGMPTPPTAMPGSMPGPIMPAAGMPGMLGRSSG